MIYQNALKQRNTTLLLAARNGHKHIVEYLLDHGSQLSEKNKNNQTALHLATVNGRLEMVKHLLNRGSQLLDVDIKNKNVAHLAARIGNLELVKYILDQNPLLAFAKTTGNKTILHYAAHSGNLDLLKYLLIIPGIPLQEKHHKGANILHICTTQNHLEAVQWLIDHCGLSASEKTEDLYGLTPLHIAAGRGHLSIVKWLLKTNPNLRFEISNDGETALEFAILTGKQEVSEILFTYEEDTYIESILPGALMIATIFSQHDIISWLLFNKLITIEIIHKLLEYALAYQTNRSTTKIQSTIQFLLHMGLGIKHNFTALDITPFADKAILIGARGHNFPLPNAIHTFEQLKQAIEDGAQFDLSAIKKIVDLHLKHKDHEDDMELSQTSKMLTQYLSIKNKYKDFSLKQSHGLAEKNFSLFFTAKNIFTILPKEICIEICRFTTKLDREEVTHVFDAIMKAIFANTAQTVKHIKP